MSNLVGYKDAQTNFILASFTTSCHCMDYDRKRIVCQEKLIGVPSTKCIFCSFW